MSMERTDYPGLLQRVQPGQAVDILNERVTQVKRLNTSIADWLQERSRLEEQYANGLRKLARKHIGDEDLGIFSVPWGTLTTSMETLAESHSSLAAKIDVDIEKPLREFATQNRDMQAMSTIQGNLASMAKDIEKAQQKTEKLAGKGDKAETNKVANASSDLGEARAQWDSQAPYVFENLQALDEARVNQLRDLLTQFVTLEVDQLEKNRAPVEQSLNVLLNVETADEIKTFALKAMSRRSSETPSRANRASMFVGSSSTPAPSQSTGLTPIQSNPDEHESHSSTPEPQKKGAFKGLKRLGTVISRRQSKLPQQMNTTSESPERKSRGLPFGRLGRNKDSYSLEPPQEESETSSQRPRSALRMGSEVLEPPRSRHATSSSGAPQLEPIPRLNGAGSGPSSASSATQQPSSTMFPNGSHQGDVADLEPPKPAQATAPQALEPPRDNDGFSVPPRNIDPISAAQAEAAAAGDRAEPAYNVNIRSAPIQEEGGEVALANVANKLALPPPTSRRAGTIRGRRDARNSAIITTHGAVSQSPSSESISPTPPVQRIDTPPSATVYLPPVQQPALQPPAHAVQQAPLQPPVMHTGLVTSPSGAFSPSASGSSSTFSTFNPTGEPQSPIRAPAPMTIDHTGDNYSIRSGRSLQSTASHALKHPDLVQPGLNSSIIETVSTRFENGQAVSSSLIGEIVLAYNPSDGSRAAVIETIRLENFANLDKVAPNPAFISQDSGKEGEYSVNTTSISRPQVAFKYQLRSEQAASQAPMLLMPAFRIEPNQAMVIVSYSLNPNFDLQGRDSLTLSSVTLALTLEGARANSCQSRPVGTFAREKNLIFWQLEDITLRPGAAPEKLLARFATDTEATGGHVEGKWEIVGGAGSSLDVSLHVNEGADPFADEKTASEGKWKTVATARRVVSGQYVAKS